MGYKEYINRIFKEAQEQPYRSPLEQRLDNLVKELITILNDAKNIGPAGEWYEKSLINQVRNILDLIELGLWADNG